MIVGMEDLQATFQFAKNSVGRIKDNSTKTFQPPVGAVSICSDKKPKIRITAQTLNTSVEQVGLLSTDVQPQIIYAMSESEPVTWFNHNNLELCFRRTPGGGVHQKLQHEIPGSDGLNKQKFRPKNLITDITEGIIRRVTRCFDLLTVILMFSL